MLQVNHVCYHDVDSVVTGPLVSIMLSTCTPKMRCDNTVNITDLYIHTLYTIAIRILSTVSCMHVYYTNTIPSINGLG